MQIPVLIERITAKRYRARGGEPLPLSAEGPTRAAALAKLKNKLQARLRNGAEIVALELDAEAHPLAEFAGMFKDDSYFKEVLEIMAENRRKMDRDPRVL